MFTSASEQTSKKTVIAWGLFDRRICRPRCLRVPSMATFLFSRNTLCPSAPLQGWYIVTYGLFIYHLNLFLAFLTPKMDPSLDLPEESGIAMTVRKYLLFAMYYTGSARPIPRTCRIDLRVAPGVSMCTLFGNPIVL